MGVERYDVWGSELSPFTLKVIALCRFAGADARLLPSAGSAPVNVRAMARVTGVRRGLRRVAYPPRDPLAELPLVPYLLASSGDVVVDSSAIAEWLDARGTKDTTLVPASGAERVAARLIDECFDELGLYCAHHNRWVVSAATNDAGERLAREFRTLVPRPLRTTMAERFSARQVRRLPYLFSVAPREPERYDLSAARRPPERAGFPPTHALLDTCFRRLLDKLEAIFRTQPFLFGEAATVADASVYGQLAMNLDDASAAATMELRAPRTVAWVRRIRAGTARSVRSPLRMSPPLESLLLEIGETFLPLMRQNEAAYVALAGKGLRHRNEAAFDRGECLYDGELLGTPFRAVAKTFQVAVWRALLAEWRHLDSSERARLPVVLE
jgi:glutathione S-transferase